MCHFVIAVDNLLPAAKVSTFFREFFMLCIKGDDSKLWVESASQITHFTRLEFMSLHFSGSRYVQPYNKFRMPQKYYLQCSLNLLYINWRFLFVITINYFLCLLENYIWFCLPLNFTKSINFVMILSNGIVSFLIIIQ